MPRLPARIAAFLLLLAGLAGTEGVAQGFDPARVNWEALAKIPMKDLFIKSFNEQCAACHGEDLRGTSLGVPLVGAPLRRGDAVEEIARSIAEGAPDKGMPAWSQTLSASQVWNLALYVAEQRQGTTILDKRAGIAIAIPEGVVQSEKHRFRIETVAEGLDPMPFAVAPLPDGRLLVSERMRGLTVIYPDGRRAQVRGTPPVYADTREFLGQVVGLGWMLDVAPHPDFRRNGWIYLHHTDRCSDCNAMSRKTGRPVSMNRLVRGRIRDETWVDEQVLWQAERETYTDTTDLTAGGRIAFDDRGHVYFSVGIKAPLEFIGIQDLGAPYGKIHRLHDDGRVPADNPFVGRAGALPSVWTYGHRSAQGLEFDPRTRTLWNTEMGPRGGDELNHLHAGGNYGWPLITRGVNYDGRPVDVGRALGLTLDPQDAVAPVLDATPSPALSSFVVYRGKAFRKWRGSFIVGTLRATDLLRIEVAGDAVVHTEVLLRDLARFRDIAVDRDGTLLLLLENAAGSRLVRLVPA
jgi:glucose/arabinose dehydrogenase